MTMDKLIEKTISFRKPIYLKLKKYWKQYLKDFGYKMEKMPKKLNGKRYTVEEFINELAYNKQTYIIKIANHLTVVKDKKLYDTWNCKNKCVGNYWII